MSKLYGFFTDNIYRMSVKSNGPIRPIDAFSSNISSLEDRMNRSMTTSVRINTMDFYKEETNEELYMKLLDFIMRSNLTGIDTLYYSFKIALDYEVTDENYCMIDGGVRYVQVDAADVYVLLNQNPETFALPYRRAQRVAKKFVISRFGNANYGIMDRRPRSIRFKINSIKVYANLTDNKSQYYIQNLGPAAEDRTYGYGSATVSSITNHSVLLFDSTMFGIKFTESKIGYMPNTICVDVDLLMNQFCQVADDSDIQNLLRENAGNTGSGNDGGNSSGNGGCSCSPFDPIVNRPPCHGNYPMPPARPGCRPPVPPCPPSIGPGGSGSTPITPGDGWDPDGTIVPKPDTNQDPGDLTEEWCTADPYDDPAIKFLVVADDISDDEYDATTMVRLSDVLPYITDAEIGWYVKKSLVLYH